MERNACSSSSTENNTRVSHTLHFKASTCLSQPKVQPVCYSNIERNVTDHKKDENRGHSRSCTLLTKLPIDILSCTKKRRLSASHIQSEGFKQVRDNRLFSTAKIESRTRLPSTERLALQNRPIAGLFPPENRQESQTFSEACVQQRASRNDLPSVRAEHSSQDLCFAHQLGCANPQRERCPNSRIPGRLFNSKSKQVYPKKSHKHCDTDIRVSGLEDKLSKVCTSPTEKTDLLRSRMGHMVESKVSAPRKGVQAYQQGVKYVTFSRDQPKRCPKSCRTAEFRQLYSTDRKTPLSCATKLPERHSEVKTTETVQNTVSGETRSNLVVSKLSVCVPDTCSPPDSFSHDRRVRCSMGCSTRQHSIVRGLVRDGKATTLQSEGNDSYPKGFRRSLSAPPQYDTSYSKRQQVGYIVSTQRGRDEVRSPLRLDLPSLSTTRSEPNSPECISHTREIQLPCGPPVEEITSSRVAPNTGNNTNYIQEMGHAGDRPVRVDKVTCGPSLCESRSERSPCSVPRCLLTEMELQPGVAISAAIPHTESTSPSQPSNGPLFVSSSSVGTSILAGGHKDTGPVTPVHSDETRESASGSVNGQASAQCPRDDVGGLESWGWSRSLVGWNQSQLDLLQTSWRPSTRKTYSIAWRRWLKWCGSSIDPTNPTGSDLAKYLADLHICDKLSYSTILLHKSVISTLCHPDKAGILSSHALVKHVLKSIALKKPVLHKPPVWDLNVLADYLGNYTVDPVNVFQTCRHTAALLLMCSGRRIHDLTLLKVDSDHCVITNDSIILWPGFGSKTDSHDYRQSGWKLLANTINKNLDPIFWLNRTIALLDNRRTEANCSNLFLSLRGDVKPASRTIIAGWIKTLLVAAGISATPGSIRSAVASRNWLDNYAMDDILSRGNWRSANTFCKFYRRQVRPAPSRTSVPSLFNPVD